MHPLLDFFKDYKWDKCPFLILGKGPSFRDTTEEERDTYNIISLNHACRGSYADIAHIIDMDVVDNLGESLLDDCIYLVMPYQPHLGYRPWKDLTLDDLSQKQPTLIKLREAGRLFGYNLSTWTQPWNDSPMVDAVYFSAEAAVSLIANLGCKKIKTLGIDGGKEQSPLFSDLPNINSWRGYDLQWKGIRRSIKEYGLNYSPLGVDSPCRIFIGAGEQQIVPALVLKHSILKHATMSVDVTIMNDWTHPMPKDAKNLPRTPFSFQRFMIPEKCNYEGHAIYMDSDMLVFADVKEIWQAPTSKAILVMRNDDIDKHRAKYSVYKIDCSHHRFAWHPISNLVSDIDNDVLSYEDLVFNFRPWQTKGQFVDWVDEHIESGWNPDWNSLEEYTEGKTKLLHYTEMYNQPWLRNPDHPLSYLWFNELKELVKEEPHILNIIQEHVKQGWLLPKCLEVLNV